MVRRLLATVVLVGLLAGCQPVTDGRFESPPSEAPQSPLAVPEQHVLYGPRLMGGPRPSMCLPAGLGLGFPVQDVLAKQGSMWARRLGATWWHNWTYVGVRDGTPALDPRQALVWWGPVAMIDGEIADARAAAEIIPCRPILMGNEPDGWGQSVHWWADKMEAWEQGAPDAYWGCCGTIVNAQGLAWLDNYFAAGGPVPDALLLHVYALWCPPWTTCDDDEERLDALWDMFSAWYVDHPYVAGLPIVVNEYGGSNRGPAEDESAMRWGAELMASDRAVKPVAMAWFSARYLDGDHLSAAMFSEQWLVDAQGQVTELGRVFQGLNGVRDGEAKER